MKTDKTTRLGLAIFVCVAMLGLCWFGRSELSRKRDGRTLRDLQERYAGRFFAIYAEGKSIPIKAGLPTVRVDSIVCARRGATVAVTLGLRGIGVEDPPYVNVTLYARDGTPLNTYPIANFAFAELKREQFKYVQDRMQAPVEADIAFVSVDGVKE